MENINSGRATRFLAIDLPVVPALIARLGGRTVALPLDTCIDLRTDDGAVGRLRYVAADGTVALHFRGEPLTHVWELPSHRVRGAGAGHQARLEALRAHLALNPRVQADLDPALVVHAA